MAGAAMDPEALHGFRPSEGGGEDWTSSDHLPLMIFKIRGSVRVLSMIGVILCIFGFLGGLIMRQESMVNGSLFLIGTMLPFILGGVIFLVGKSDVVINHQSISRCFLGITLQAIEWSDISIVKVFPMGRGASGKVSMGINIIPTSRSNFSFFPRKIWFSEQAEDIGELIEVLNQYIKEYQIKVERNVDGIIARSTCI